MSKKNKKASSIRRWFSCSFEESKQSNSALSLSSANGKHRNSASSITKNAITSCSDDENMPHIVEIDDDEVVFVCETINSSSQSKNYSCHIDYYESIFDRFAPTTSDQLAVHSKKIEQVRQWLLNHRNGMRQSKILLLTGPCGTGKTATVKVLCNELQMELVEWESPDHYDITYNENGEEVICEQSQVRVFADFIRSVDYGSLESSQAQKVVLIEHLPNVFYREPNLLHSLLRTHAMYSRCIFIFVLSSIESCWTLSPRRLFPISTLRELNFNTITFNPSAITFISKAIRRILIELKINSTPTQIKYIANSSAGDIRCAINNLQLSIGENGQLLKDVDLFGSSSQTDPFHAIGKMLYGKRAEEDSAEWIECENLISKSLKERFYRRRPPKDAIHDIIQKAAMSGDNIAAYLEEHEPYFMESLSVIRAVFDNISLMDSAFTSWEVRMNPSLNEYEAEVAARSAVFYNYGCKRNSGRGMHNFSKPRWWATKSRVETLIKDARSAFPESTSTDLFTLLLPMISHLGLSLDICQRHVLAMLNWKEGIAESDRWISDQSVDSDITSYNRIFSNGPQTAMQEDNFDIEEVEDDDWP